MKKQSIAGVVVLIAPFVFSPAMAGGVSLPAGTASGVTLPNLSTATPTSGTALPAMPTAASTLPALAPAAASAAASGNNTLPGLDGLGGTQAAASGGSQGNAIRPIRVPGTNLIPIPIPGIQNGSGS